MATINCPHRHLWITELSSKVTVATCEVTIFNDICGSCDKCGHKSCEYFDESPEASVLFNQALAHSHTSIEAMQADKAYEKALKQKHALDFNRRK